MAGSKISQVVGWLGQAEAAVRKGFVAGGIPEESIDEAIDRLLQSEDGQCRLRFMAYKFAIEHSDRASYQFTAVGDPVKLTVNHGMQPRDALVLMNQQVTDFGYESASSQGEASAMLQIGRLDREWTLGSATAWLRRTQGQYRAPGFATAIAYAKHCERTRTGHNDRAVYFPEEYFAAWYGRWNRTLEVCALVHERETYLIESGRRLSSDCLIGVLVN